MPTHPRYQLLEKIGSGSFATVYRGRDVELGRDVAIKQIHEQYLADPQQLDRYWQEAQLLASFQHPNIVTIYDIVRDNGWLILELMQGNLAKVSGRKPMDLNALRTTLAHCLRALKFLHAHGIIHGDIKPGNIMIDRRRRVKIGDFGLARRASDEQGSLIKGTTKYMAPEVVSDEFGEVGPASDLYSLGFAAYELMCGENFESLFPGLSAFGRDKQMAWMMWHAAPDRRLPEIKRVLEGVPDDLAKVIQKLTAKPQSERYRTADEALSDLNIDIKLVKTGEESGDAPGNRSVSDAKRKRLLAVGAFSASLVMSLLLLLMPSGNGKTSPSTAKPVTGVIREVHAAQQKLEIEDEQGIPSEVELGEKPRIHLNEERYILTKDLRPGDRVQIRRETKADGSVEVNIISLRPEQNRGVIKTIRAADSELVLEDAAQRDQVPLRVPVGAKIFLNGKTTPLADLRPDDRAEATHLKDLQGLASRVVIRLDVYRTVQMTGFIEQIDAAKRRMTVRQRGPGAQSVPVELADKCRVTINGNGETDGRPLDTADLKVGDRVVLALDTRVESVAASRRQQIAGTLMDIREESRSISIQPDRGPRIVFNVDASCEITLSRESAKLSDLRPYDNVDITFDTIENAPSEARTLDVVRPIKADRMAILIGVQNYADRNVSRLPYALEDAKLIRETLIKRYAFAPERILFLEDATRDSIRQSIPDWLKRTSNLTQVLVYFGGHAYTDDTGRVFLAPRDLGWNHLSESGVSLEWLAGELDACIAREKILLLDATHAGNGVDLERQFSGEEMLRTIAAGPAAKLKSTAAIANSKRGERGRDWPEKQHGLFAWSIAEAFSGRADRDRDLVVDTKELFEFLVSRMTRSTVDGQPTQTPVLLP